jgi:thymidylate synthase
MNNLDRQYTDLLQDILDNGTRKMDRTGTGTLSVFGRQIRHKMSEGFPLLTTKKMPFRLVATELLWFLRGDTNIKFLVDNDCHIWDGDAYKNYVKHWEPMIEYIDNKPILTQEDFINKIKTDDEFAKTWGELGPIYGHQWRNLNSTKSKQRFFDKPIPYDRFVDNRDGIDQLANSINLLKTDPDSRRNRVSSWNVGELDQMVLPPCHTDFQFYTRELSDKERIEWMGGKIQEKYPALVEQQIKHCDEHNVPKRAISLMWNQRSVDTFLGLPFNIASYGLLLEIIAKAVNMVPDELIGNLGDTHLYLNHVEQAKEQIGRKLDLEERRAMVTQEMFNQIYNAGDSSMLTHSEIDQWNIPRIKTREPYTLPTLVINDEFWNLDADLLSNLPHIQVSDFYVDNYQAHPTIKAPLSN